MPDKEYRDPIYGFISIDEVEQEVIDSWAFQRLRHIAQLGTTSWVYPSACHTRFEHSLGTLQSTTLLFDHLVSHEQDRAILEWDNATLREMRQILRLAALLHDIGQPPFSHASEILLDVKSHEEYSRLIITQTEISRLLEKKLGKNAPDKIANIATGSGLLSKAESFISSLLTGDIGTDRVDYLIRDSHHLGVAYGRFDVHRLLNSLHILYDKDKMGPELAIDEGGVHSVEGLLLARYFMFLEVYFHKTRRILDYHLQECLSQLLENGKYPTNIDDYLLWDDHKVLNLLQSRPTLNHTQRLLARKHFRCICETTDHPNGGELVAFEWLWSELKREFGILSLHFDEATKAPLNYRRPPLFMLRENNKYESLAEKSTLIGKLETIRKVRVYAEPTVRSTVQNYCETFLSERKLKER